MPQTMRKQKHPLALYKFTEDFGAQLIEGISVALNTLNQAQAHTLGRVPSMVLIIKEQGGKVEHGTTAVTSTNIYLSNRGTTAATVSILVFP